MDPEELFRMLHVQPFEPLRLHLSDGTWHDIQHPELVRVTQRMVFLFEGVDDPTKDLPLDWRGVAPSHIVRVEPRRLATAATRGG